MRNGEFLETDIFFPQIWQKIKNLKFADNGDIDTRQVSYSNHPYTKRVQYFNGKKLALVAKCFSDAVRSWYQKVHFSNGYQED